MFLFAVWEPGRARVENDFRRSAIHSRHRTATAPQTRRDGGTTGDDLVTTRKHAAPDELRFTTTTTTWSRLHSYICHFAVGLFTCTSRDVVSVQSAGQLPASADAIKRHEVDQLVNGQAEAQRNLRDIRLEIHVHVHAWLYKQTCRYTSKVVMKRYFQYSLVGCS